MKTEYLGVTKDGVPVVVRYDGCHWRAFRKDTAAEEEIGAAKIKYSDLFKELGLKMDQSRPETAPAGGGQESQGMIGGIDPALETEAINSLRARGVTRAGVKVEVIFNGTHYIARDGAGNVVGAPRVELPALGKLLGIAYESEGSVPPPPETEEEAEAARIMAEAELARMKAEAELARMKAEADAKVKKADDEAGIEAAGASAAVAGAVVVGATEHKPAPEREYLPEEIVKNSDSQNGDLRPLTAAEEKDVRAREAEAEADPAGIAGPLDSSGPERV